VQAKEPGYFAAYRSLKFTRDAQGVLPKSRGVTPGHISFNR